MLQLSLTHHSIACNCRALPHFGGWRGGEHHKRFQRGSFTNRPSGCWGIRDGCGVPGRTLATPANSDHAHTSAWLHAMLHLIPNIRPLLLLSMMLALILSSPWIRNSLCTCHASHARASLTIQPVSLKLTLMWRQGLRASMLLAADLATATWLPSVLIVARKACELRLQSFCIFLPPAFDVLSVNDVSQLHTKQTAVFQGPDSHILHSLPASRGQKREIAGLDCSLAGGMTFQRDDALEKSRSNTLTQM